MQAFNNMQVFKAFYKISIKRLPATSLYFIIFAVITVILGLNGRDTINSNFQSTALRVCVIDEDQSDASHAVTDYLGSIHKLVTLENTPEVLQDNLYYRYVDYILTIPAGFESKLTNGDTSGLYTNTTIPGSANGRFVDQQLSSYTRTLQVYLAGGDTLAQSIQNASTALSNASSVKSVAFEQTSSTSTQSVFYLLRYLPYMFISMMICGFATILVTFNATDLKNRMTCSALTLMDRNRQLILGSIIYSILIWLAFILLGVVVFFRYLPQLLTMNMFLGICNSLIFMLFALALAFLISCFSLNSNESNMVANIIGLGMSFLCGIFVPQNMLSPNLLSFSKFLPAYWYTRVNDMVGGLSSEAMNMHFILTAFGIQLLFAFALFAAALATTKIKQR